MNSGKSDYFCSLCGSKLIIQKYAGNKPEILALMARDDFCCFLVCENVEGHKGRFVDGMDCTGKVFVRTLFHHR